MVGTSAGTGTSWTSWFNRYSDGSDRDPLTGMHGLPNPASAPPPVAGAPTVTMGAILTYTPSELKVFSQASTPPPPLVIGQTYSAPTPIIGQTYSVPAPIIGSTSTTQSGQLYTPPI